MHGSNPKTYSTKNAKEREAVDKPMRPKKYSLFFDIVSNFC